MARNLDPLQLLCDHHPRKLFLIWPNAKVVSTTPPIDTYLSQRSSQATFNDLPAEIIMLIFTHISAFSDVIRFGLTNSRVWDCGERHIEQAYLQFQAPWKGHRLICLGDYSSDIPPHLNNATDLCQLAITLGFPNRDRHVCFSTSGQNPDRSSSEGEDEASSGSVVLSDTSSTAICSSERANIRFEELATPEAKGHWECRLGKLVRGIHVRATEIDIDADTDYKLVNDAKRVPEAMSWVEQVPIRYSLAYRKYNPSSLSTISNTGDKESSEVSKKESETDIAPEDVLLLRNLTKQQYLRSDTFVGDGDIERNFGRALISQICWSTGPSISMRWYDNIHRGRWAGDAFDAVWATEVAQDWEDQLATAGWKDVTGEVLREMQSIWKPGQEY